MRIVITGGPGAGKTALLDELTRRGYPCAADTARAIIQERKNRGLPPRPEPHEFASEILRRDIERYRSSHENSSLLFFDRSILDALCMLDQVGALPSDERDRYLAEYPYHHQVFVLPPWPDIYRTDSERDQTFDEASRVHATVREWYLRCGYELVTVPPGPLASRCEFVLNEVDRSGSMTPRSPLRPSRTASVIPSPVDKPL